MDATTQSAFERAALASGLVSQHQLDAARTAIADETDARITDARLTAKLIAQGLLNRWQAEQLKEGRVKFTLGPYRIVDSIGKGGMGHVFKAQHEMLGRVEAIKVLPKERTSPDTIDSFQREIRAQAQLDHPNLVRVTYAGQDGETYFLVMEYVPGTDLRNLVRRHGRLTMQQAATIISQSAQGLAHAHANGLVHRDVKPGNLLVTSQGRTKVTDLGLAWRLQGDDTGDKYSGKLVGTADYLAPELVRANSGPAPSTDIYSLGCTLYYATTGKVPFPGGTTSTKLKRHLRELPISPLRFNPELSDIFLDVVADMLEKDPLRRLQSMDDVVERLQPWSLDNVGLDDSTVVRIDADENDAPNASEPDGSQPTLPTVTPHDDTGPITVRPRSPIHRQPTNTAMRTTFFIMGVVALTGLVAALALLFVR